MLALPVPCSDNDRVPVPPHDIGTFVVGQRAADRLREVVHLGAQASRNLACNVVLLTARKEKLDGLQVSFEQVRPAARRIRSDASARSDIQNLAETSDDAHDARDDEPDPASHVDDVNEGLKGLAVWERGAGSRHNPCVSAQQREEYQEGSHMKGDASDGARGRPERPDEIDRAQSDGASGESYDWHVDDAPDWRGLEDGSGAGEQQPRECGDEQQPEQADGQKNHLDERVESRDPILEPHDRGQTAWVPIRAEQPPPLPEINRRERERRTREQQESSPRERNHDFYDAPLEVVGRSQTQRGSDHRES